jgi:hypothetical protein
LGNRQGHEEVEQAHRSSGNPALTTSIGHSLHRL